jgi:UDP-glucose 4-epimerase
MELKGKRILITGGAGLIGSHIADQLSVLDPEEIIVFDNFVRGRRENIRRLLEQNKVTVIEGDIRDCEALARAM